MHNYNPVFLSSPAFDYSQEKTETAIHNREKHDSDSMQSSFNSYSTASSSCNANTPCSSAFRSQSVKETTNETSKRELNFAGFLIRFPEALDTLAQYKQLKQIYLPYNELKERLQCLRTLDLSHNLLSDLPEEFGNLQYLERVDLSHNKLAVFPKHLCEISDITEIVLDYNTIADIPSEFGNIFSYLEVFTISHNRIARIPKSIGKATELEVLDFSHNFIAEVPSQIVTLKNLFKLHLNNNNISAIPEYIGKMKCLEELYLSHNKIDQVPESICFLSSLSVLTLSHNLISKLPIGIDRLSNLYALSLTHNPMNNLPKKNSKKMLWLSVPKNVIPEDVLQMNKRGGLDPSLYPDTI